MLLIMEVNSQIRVILRTDMGMMGHDDGMMFDMFGSLTWMTRWTLPSPRPQSVAMWSPHRNCEFSLLLQFFLYWDSYLFSS